MRPLEKKKKTFKASHFENIQELLDTCKMWIRDDDYDAYCRFFDMGAMEELLNELETLQNGFNTAVEHQTELIRENTNFRYQLFNNKKELEKKDKIIDAMAEVIEECRQNDCLESEDIDLSQIAGTKAIKQYFEKEVKDE